MTDRQLNALGYVVGGSAHQPLMVRARGLDGVERWIDEVPRGQACNCTCLECGSPVVARQGAVREWSFAHAASSSCSGGVETLAHRFAKEVIADAGGLYIASTDPMGWNTLHPDFIALDDLCSEQRIAGLTADLAGSRNGRLLIIEIKVSHRCSEEKVAAYAKANISVLEIDLAPHRHASNDQLRQAVLKDAHRYWLYLSDNRALPRKPSTFSAEDSRDVFRGGLRRPRHVSARAWNAMSPLEKVNAIDPDGRLAIRSRGAERRSRWPSY